MLNAYRVLLTRARSGMIICVPEGNPHKTTTGFWEDETRLPEYYEGTYKYLKNIGFEEKYVTYADYHNYLQKYQLSLVETEGLI